LDVPGLTRMDTHVHSHASDKPVIAAAGFIGAPECYTTPEQVYDQAMARGMDLVTITDHDTIAGAMELVERGFERFVPGEEVTVYFPEDRCKLHVLVWALSPEQHEQIETLELRNDVYSFAAWLREQDLPHSLAHPLYVQNGRLDLWHIERATLLFKCFETLNGAHSGTHRSAIEQFLSNVNSEKIRELSVRHGINPIWPGSSVKGRTGGSDDHGMLNIGKTWTAVRGPNAERITDPKVFFRLVMGGRSEVGGAAGHSALLAHQLTTVGAHHFGANYADRADPVGQAVASRLVRFAGVSVPKPSKARLALHKLKKKVRGKKSDLPPIVEALRETIGPVLEQYPDLKGRLDPDRWTEGTAFSEHERMAQFADDLSAALGRAMSSGAARALRERDRSGIADHLVSYLILHAAQLPYLFSLFHQNKERQLVERFMHETSEPGSGQSPLERPMRVSLFTDTLGDVNGVCRFIKNMAAQATEAGCDLEVITSTQMPCPNWENIYNFKPIFATKMPRYEQLEATLPPIMKMLRHVERHQPDVIHISTPGPVGLIGYIAAKMLRVPVLGVYHTDFPAYIERLFEDQAFTWATKKYMKAFYEPFSAIFTRSEDYVESLAALGMRRERILSLLPGVETEAFHPRFADDQIWEDVNHAEAGASSSSVKVLYVGRVSVEKNLPMLTSVWKKVHRACREKGLDAELIVVGDGPYSDTMKRELKGCKTRFLGFRHGRELAALYASSDVFAFPSTTDTLGQVVLEAQASGIPVLVTDQGGPKEVVVEGETGHVLPAEGSAAVNQWADRLVALIDDTDLRESMGEAAHRYAQNYSIRGSFDHFWKVHTEAWHDHLATIGISPETAGRGAGVMNGTRNGAGRIGPGRNGGDPGLGKVGGRLRVHDESDEGAETSAS
jgi:glycosyltransferase involved in cell wall biosynthesis